MTQKVVITGVGTINPLGHSVEETWKNILNGVSGVGPITRFDTTDYLVKIACEIKNYDPEQFMSARDARRRDRFEQYGIIAAKQALESSGLEITEENASRVGVMISAAIGGLGTIEEAVNIIAEKGPRRVSPFVIPMLMPNGASGLFGIEIGATGPSFSVASACASGQDGIGMAWMMIKSGMIDAAFAGASEATIFPIGVASFDRLGAMSRSNDDYSMTPQPFDKNRNGLVMGEGAAVLMLESEAHAKARGAIILAELAGYASTADAYHVTAPHEYGVGGSKAMRMAMDAAGVNPHEVDYISAHGTATPLNDAAETRAVKSAFGKLAYDIPLSSTKSMTGHMMGATGALESIFCALAIRDNVLPPTIHYETPDPDCDLDVIPNQPREKQTHVTLTNAFGFGGHNAVLVIRRYTG
jgi:beta-ketoacyl-acyl-carrier-protein synthase II